MFLDYGYRSSCCYAAIRMGNKKIKGTTKPVKIWICCKCGKKDADLVEYNKTGTAQSTTPTSRHAFASDEEVDTVDPTML